jgi:hypothetical protein
MTGSQTPETDKEISVGLENADRECVSVEFARRIERERDEARQELSDWENAALHVEADHPDEKHCGCVPVLRKLLTDAREAFDEEKKWHHRTHTELVHTQCKILDMQMGRDEIQKKYDNLATEHMLVVNKLCNERDEAIEKHRFAVIHWQIGVAKMERERDDALNQITGWENKWKAAVEMAAIAENKVSNLEDQVDLAMKVIKRLEANKP